MGNDTVPCSFVYMIMPIVCVIMFVPYSLIFHLGQCQSEDYDSWYDENAGLWKIMDIPIFFWLFMIMTVIWYTFVLKVFCCGKNSVRRLSMNDSNQLPKYLKPASVEEVTLLFVNTTNCQNTYLSVKYLSIYQMSSYQMS